MGYNCRWKVCWMHDVSQSSLNTFCFSFYVSHSNGLLCHNKWHTAFLQTFYIFFAIFVMYRNGQKVSRNCPPYCPEIVLAKLRCTEMILYRSHPPLYPEVVMYWSGPNRHCRPVHGAWIIRPAPFTVWPDPFKQLHFQTRPVVFFWLGLFPAEFPNCGPTKVVKR